MTDHSYFWLRRLRIMKSGIPLYDQSFHLGVNIIRGENGSGKSTISDFIFYALGGEFENWKTYAQRCEEVQAEVVTKGGTLTLRREVGRAQTPILIFFGPMAEAERHGIDGWSQYPIRRKEKSESFTQILFRAAGIPEAQSQGASNITMNQMLRLLYSDQRTPAAFLFRYEPFDTREIREAVGDLVCGLSVYELYEIELRLRDKNKEFDQVSGRLRALLDAVSRDEALARPEAIDEEIEKLRGEYRRVAQEIQEVEKYVQDKKVKEFARERSKAADELRKIREKISKDEGRLAVQKLEVADLLSFLEHLSEISERLPKAQTTSDIVGNIEFTHCPACLTELSDDKGPEHCIVCGAKTDPELERSRYLQIKLDIDIQIRESTQLLEEKQKGIFQIEREIRETKKEYESSLSEYTVKYDVSTSPRESFVAERYQRLGQIDRELTYLDKVRERATEIQNLSDEKAALQTELTRLGDGKKALEAEGRKRKSIAMTKVSEIAKRVLRQDVERQEEFYSADQVSLNFADNSVLVDNELNFAESSNVIVKNSAILSLLLAAAEDPAFHHPRFILLDNIEDKGMEPDRTHNFQRVIVNESRQAKLQHQIIFTTSTPNPELDDEELVVGPHYTHNNRTLNLRSR